MKRATLLAILLLSTAVFDAFYTTTGAEVDFQASKAQVENPSLENSMVLRAVHKSYTGYLYLSIVGLGFLLYVPEIRKFISQN